MRGSARARKNLFVSRSDHISKSFLFCSNFYVISEQNPKDLRDTVNIHKPLFNTQTRITYRVVVKSVDDTFDVSTKKIAFFHIFFRLSKGSHLATVASRVKSFRYSIVYHLRNKFIFLSESIIYIFISKKIV